MQRTSLNSAPVSVVYLPATYPVIHFRYFEFPQPPNLVGRHIPISNPTVNCVLADTQMLGDTL